MENEGRVIPEGQCDAAAGPAGPVDAQMVSPGTAGEAGGAGGESATTAEQPPLSFEQVADALALMASYFQTEDLTYAEVDGRLSRKEGYTGLVLRGDVAYTHRAGRAIRAAMGIDEKKFEEEMQQREAVRKYLASAKSLVPLLNGPKVRHPRRKRTGGRRPEPERQEAPSALHAPEVWDKLTELRTALLAELLKREPPKP
jgi:hypothetical protein